MRIDWLKREGNNRLALIVLGWACDPQVVRHLDPWGYDILCLYDYRDLEKVLNGDSVPTLQSLKDTLGRYSHLTLIAWSFGVWVSERLFGAGGICPIVFDKATALNGTPLPTDEHFGIGTRRLLVTVRGLAKGGKEEFNRKTYGKWYDRMSDRLSARPLENNVDELQALLSLASEKYKPSVDWDTAFVGSEDMIFPPDNMVRYWGERARVIDMPHFPFGDERILKELF